MGHRREWSSGHQSKVDGVQSAFQHTAPPIKVLAWHVQLLHANLLYLNGDCPARPCALPAQSDVSGMRQAHAWLQ